MNNYNKKFIKIFLCLLFIVNLFAISPVKIFADDSKAYFQTSNTKIAPNSEISVEVFINSTQSINALEMEVSYSPINLQFLKADLSKSVVTFWQSGNILLSDGHIGLSGGMIPPFKGSGGLVATLHFKSLIAGDTKISFVQSNSFLADGTGTRVALSSQPLTISISNAAPIIVPPEKVKDTTPPTLVIRQIIDPISGKKLVFYNTTDTESDVKIVEMRTIIRGRWSEWSKIGNPVEIPSGISTLEIRATNNDGVSTTESLKINNGINNFTIIIIIICVILLILVYNRKRLMPKI